MKFFLLLILIPFSTYMQAQSVIELYKDAVPNNKQKLKKEDEPTITAYFPAKDSANGSAILIFPGGGYGFLAFKEEGTDIAEAFRQKGFAAFVVKYRLPSDATMRDKSVGPLQDAQQAIKYVRMNAPKYGIDSNKIGIIGFSAGGHLASTLGTHFDTSFIPNKEKINLRPDFMILVYPVISMDNSLTHRGSRINLLGEYPSMERVLYFSSEEQVKKNTPPTYLTHAGDDQVVDVQNSIEMYQSLLKKGVPAELHLFPKGDHGFTQRLPVEEWLQPILLFLKKQGFYH